MASSTSLSSLIGTVLFAVIGIVLVIAVGVPIISEFTVDSTVANADAINTMIGVIPLFLVLMILIVVAYQIIRYTNSKD